MLWHGLAPLCKNTCFPHRQSDMLGKPSEPLLAELTVETLTYLRGVLVHQMKQGIRLSMPDCRHRQAPDDRLIIHGVDNVYWSASRKKYLARARDAESSKVKQCFIKSLDDALEFARSGTKSSTQQHRGEDSEHSEQDEEHSEQDGKPSENDNDIKLSGSDKENEND